MVDCECGMYLGLLISHCTYCRPSKSIFHIHCLLSAQARYADNENVYKTFLEILNSYRKGQRSINLVYEEVSLLFNKQPDLLEEFTYFLPDSTPPQV